MPLISIITISDQKWKGNENGIYILQSIDHGLFELGTTNDTLGTTPKGGVLLGPERPRTYDDLNDNDKKRFDADVRATNIVLQGLPKDIYKLINHNIEAKAIWDNVKMLLAGSELTKEDKESQLYDEFERFKMLPGENINEYYVQFHKLINDMRNIRMTMPNIQLNSKFVNNMSPEWDRFVTAVKLNKGLKETNHEQLYAYLKQHETHAAQDRLIVEIITPTTNDQLAFDGRVVVQNVQGRQNQNQRKLREMVQQEIGERRIELGMPVIENRSSVIIDKMLLMQAQENGAVLDEEELLFLAGKETNTFDVDVDNQPVRDLALNEDNIFQLGQQIYKLVHLMRNGLGHIALNFTQAKHPQNSNYFKDKMLLMQAQENGAVLDEEELLFLAGEQTNTFDADMDNQPIRDLTLNEDSIFQADECGAFDSDVDDEPTTHASYVPNDAYVLHDNDAYVPPDPLATELNIYKEQVAIYEQCTKFELTLREQKMDEQMSILIRDRNKKEENLKKELHPVKLQLNSTIQNNKIIEETVTTLKQEFTQKESKFLSDFSNLKNLKDKLENKLYSQDQSIQTVHMMLKPKKLYDQDAKMTIGIQNPFYPKKAKKAQPALYDGDELLKTHHVPVIVTSSKEDLELAKTTRIKMNEKMNDSECVENRVNIMPPNYSKENFMATFTPQTQLTPEQVFCSIELLKQRTEDLKANAPPLPVLPPAIVYPLNTLVYLVPRTLPTTSQVNIEVRAMKTVFENIKAEVDQNAIDKKCREIKHKNLLIINENLIANCIAQDVFYTVTDSALTTSRFHDLSTAYNVAMKRIVELESENFNLKKKIQNDDHNEMIKHFYKLEVEHFNLQLKYQHLKECFGNKKPMTSSDAPTFDSVFVIGKLKEQVQSRGNTIPELKEKIYRLTKKHSDADPILDLKALVSQNKDLTAKLNALRDLNERFRAEKYKINSKCVTIPDGRPKVLTPGRYAIDVEPIPSRNKNNREVHLDYIKHLKESVETLREIIEEAKVERPLDSSLASACRYTKHSQELLEYVIGTCPKEFIPRDKQHASTPLIRKKQVTFADPLETSGTNRPKHVKQQIVHKTNVPIIHSTGVSNATKARRSQPKSKKMYDKTLPANSVPKKKVEDHHRNNKSKLSKTNRVDSSTSVRRTVFNMNSNSICKTLGYHWKPTGRIFPLDEQCPLTRITKPKVKPVKQWKPIGRLIPLEEQCPLVRPTALNSSTRLPDPQENNPPVVQIVLWYLDSGCSKHMTGDRSQLRNFVKKFIGTVRFENNHFGAIMGYGDYVIGDSVISKVYYVEGLGHNLFSVSQFCDSDLEVAFRKHTCFVRDLDGVDLIKGSRGTNLYTISVEDMMRSSSIFLLPKASKNKSWLWHRRLNHLNFGTINDLARKDLVRGLPRLKFEKYHLCSACQLGKRRKATHQPKSINTIMEVLQTLHMDLCGPLRVQSINGKKYILVIVDDYSRFTWVKFLRSKDETPEFVIKLTPQQNGIVEQQNRTLVEAAQTMLIFSKASLFLGQKLLLLPVTPKTALYYPTNDRDDLGKLKAKADIRFFVGYAPKRKGY
ncbi:retrovirus-related pol polyprotein from transposon TNT 1-94 [Tanacetum coccineum]